MTMPNIQGYTYGEAGVSPVTMKDLEALKATVLFGPEDELYLRMASHVLRDQTDAVLDLWYGFVGSHPHLVHYFTHNGKPNMEYLTAVRARFAQWIMDLCEKPYDQAWLNYQQEVALRHHSTKKNQTDGVEAVPIIHMRHLVAFIFPITATIKDFLGNKGHSASDVEKMHAAWFKAVTRPTPGPTDRASTSSGYGSSSRLATRGFAFTFKPCRASSGRDHSSWPSLVHALPPTTISGTPSRSRSTTSTRVALPPPLVLT